MANIRIPPPGLVGKNIDTHLYPDFAAHTMMVGQAWTADLNDANNDGYYGPYDSVPSQVIAQIISALSLFSNYILSDVASAINTYAPLVETALDQILPAAYGYQITVFGVIQEALQVFNRQFAGSVSVSAAINTYAPLIGFAIDRAIASQNNGQLGGTPTPAPRFSVLTPDMLSRAISAVADGPTLLRTIPNVSPPVVADANTMDYPVSATTAAAAAQAPSFTSGVARRADTSCFEAYICYTFLYGTTPSVGPGPNIGVQGSNCPACEHICDTASM